jgi:hypothetical protein
MMCRMDTTPTELEIMRARVAAQRACDLRLSTAHDLCAYRDALIAKRDPFANDPDRTTRQFVASVPPGDQR